jgi:dipeptidyl aminopeptidase/acylaminoacyl peptidase
MSRQYVVTLTSLVVLTSVLSCRSAPQCSSCNDQPAPKPPAVSAEEPEAPLEDELGVAGAPVNETEFDFEPLASEEVVELEVEGVPDTPEQLQAELAPFLKSRRARLQSFGANGKWMTFISRIGPTAQAHHVDAPLGEPTQLTFADEPIIQFAGVPAIKGAYTFRTDVGGAEDYQILRLDNDSGAVMLTDGQSRNGPFVWSPTGDHLAYTSNARDPDHMDVYLAPNKREANPKLLLERTGSWTASSWSPDGKKLLIRNYLAYNHSTFHIVDVDSGKTRALAPLEQGTAYTRARFGPDGAIYTVSNRDGEHLDLWRVELGSGDWQNLTEDLDWDVDELALHQASGRVAFTTNEDGISRLWMYEPGSGRTALELPNGVVSSLRIARGGEVVAFTLDRPTQTGDVYTLDTADASLTRWSNSMPTDLDSSSFVEPRLIRFESFDGVEIPAWAYVPDDDGPHPVLIWVHGGPESQYQPTFNPIIQFLVTRLGIAVIGPNIRGSTGYGKTFASLDNTHQREDAVRDIGALLDWLTESLEFDADKVGIYGGSYGGYIVLASMIHYADRIAAGCDMVGISNFVTFLENTRSYRTDNRRAEYGDERDPEMREFLEEISPLSRANEIVKPLFIVHGENDPRVPVGEARQMFEAVRQNGQDAWLMVAHDEGHGFSKRRNRDAFYRAFVMFFHKHLLEAQ